MADTIVQYILRMGDETSETLESVGDAADDTAKKTSGLSDETKKADLNLKKMAAGAAAAVGAVIALGQKLADVRNLLTDMSTRTGIATETLAGLRLAATGSGLAFESLARNLGKIPQLIADVERGSTKQVEAFRAIGMSVEDIRGAGPDEVFREMMLGLSAIEDPGRRAVAATDLLGASGTRLLQALGDPAQLEKFIAFTREFGIDVGPEAAAASGEWERAMADLGMVVEAQTAKLFSAFGGDGIGGLIDDFTAGIQFMGDVAIPLVKGALGSLMDTFIGFKILITEGTDAWTEFTVESAAARTSIADLPELLTAASERLMEFRKGQRETRDATREADAALKALIASLGSSSDEIETLTETLDPAAVALAEFVAEFGEMDAIGGSVDSLRASVAHLFADMGDGLSVADSLQMELIDLGRALREESITADEYAHAVANVNGQLSALTATASGASGGGLGIALDIGGGLAGGDVGGALTSALSAFLGPLGGLIGGAVQTLATIGERGADAILDDVISFVENVFAGLPEIAQIIQELPLRLLKALPGILQGLLEGLLSGEGLAIWMEGIRYLLMELPGALFDTFKTAISEGLAQLWADFVAWWESAGGAAREYVTAGEDDRRLFGNLWDDATEGIAEMFSFDKGGRVSRTGLAVVHRGERIVQPGAAAGGSARAAMGGGGGVNVTINSMITDRNAIPRLVRELERVYGDYGRSTSPILGG